MRRTIAVLWIAVVIVLPGVLTKELAAQEATPVASQSIEYFVAIASERAPGQTVYLIRFTLQPGAEIEAHSHPGTTILAVEGGALGYTLLEGTAHVIRNPDAGGSMTTESISEPGTDVILEAGDTIYYEADVTHTARNAGDMPAHVFATHILENGQPLSIPPSTTSTGMEYMATPNATTTD